MEIIFNLKADHNSLVKPLVINNDFEIVNIISIQNQCDSQSAIHKKNVSQVMLK